MLFDNLAGKKSMGKVVFFCSAGYQKTEIKKYASVNI
jgi:hypothetical protein